MGDPATETEWTPDGVVPLAAGETEWTPDGIIDAAPARRKPGRDDEAKASEIQPILSPQTRATQLAPFDIQGSTGGEDTMPTRTARTPQTMLPEMQVQGDTGPVARADRVSFDLPPVVREGITALRRAGQATSPMTPIARSMGLDVPDAAPPETVDFSPRAGALGALSAVPFTARGAAALRAATGPESFSEAHGAVRGEIDRSAAEYPEETQLGQVGATAAMLGLPSAPAAVGRALAARGAGGVVQGLGRIAAGTAEGAAFGAGLSRADDAGGLVRDTALGAVGGLLPEAIGGAMRGASHLRRETARGTAAAAVGQRVAAAGPTAGQLRRAQERHVGGLPGLAQNMERLGMSGATMTAPQIAARADEVVAQAGPEMGRILREASEGAAQGYRDGAPLGIDRSTLAQQIHSRVIADLEAQPGVQARRAARELNQWLDDFQFVDEALTPEAAHQAQVQLGKLAGFDQARTNISREGYADMRRILGEAVDEALEQAGQRIGDPTLAQRYAQARRDYQTAATVADFTGPSRDTANRVVSLTDTIAATGGALAGGPAGALTGAAAAAANRWLRRREHSLAAAGLDRLTQMLERPGMLDRLSPQTRTALANAARRGPALYSATVFSALQTAAPEEREAIQAAIEGGTEETAP